MTTSKDVVTFQSHLVDHQRKHPEATGALSWILISVSVSAKMIAAKIRRARLEGVLGALESENVQGEVQQKLDVIADRIMRHNVGEKEPVAILGSEEEEDVHALRLQTDGERRYNVLFDPLDGSSNLDTCGAVGTIFSVLRHDRRADDPVNSVLQPGTQQVAAGYVLYGSSTVFVYTAGDGVHVFELDPNVGTFFRVKADLQIPATGKIYSLNEGNRRSMPQGYRDYLDWAQSNGYSSRYIGAMVADVHRTLLKGGVFLYPPTESSPNGKLRLLYEVNPMAMLVEQAGGKALSGDQRAMDIRPTELHQRVPIVLGSPDEVDRVYDHLK
ncbi:Fructose-1,6-bisphosphatase class 1 [Planctomycetes bacterium Pla163]|uniref:Fructose-1,6-bisphosphatase class 1 n=1 Tax=Rohdeia mirabilis TaxID=2528008 RepID=A0A518CYC5_9BACT|nr:Fructose-1,6-bisphosphatase class 1 [Planctomycetes bacterium Pla163]